MAYEKQEWNCGDTITAEKMNHIEEGIESGVLIVSPTAFTKEGGVTTITFDKTWQEIKDALDAHIPCYLTINLGMVFVVTESLDMVPTGMFPILFADAETIPISAFVISKGMGASADTYLNANSASDYVYYQIELV